MPLSSLRAVLSVTVSVSLQALRTKSSLPLSLAPVAICAAMLGFGTSHAQAQTESVLVNFTGTTGAAPGATPKYGNLIQASDGNFYGLTSVGGANNDGAAFQMTPAGAYTLLHSFGGTADGLYPYGSLVQGTDGNFYGMTQQSNVNPGGSGTNYGAVFKMTSAGVVTVLHNFTGGTADGASPYGSLVQGTDGNFYGMTYSGGATNNGVAFQMTPAGAVTLLHSFAGGTGDGKYPYGSLVQGTDGNFYGITQQGGAYSDGIVFQMTPAGVVTLLHSFAGGTADGAYSYGSLLQGTDGNFYGMTQQSGANYDGTAFQMTPAGAVTLLHSFAGGTADGARPYGNLVQGSDGNFYGMTYSGGATNGGVVFEMTTAGTVTLLYNFAGGTGDGKNPQGSLVQGSDGNFYGMTDFFGASSDGVIFKQTTATTLAAPVALSSSATSVVAGGAFTLTYSVANAYTGATNGSNAGSGTLGYCFASNTAGNATWTGVKTGSATAATSPSLTASSTPGTYTYSLTCGGVESNLVTLTVTPPPPPTVTGVSPAGGTVSGGTSVTLTGTHFTGATTVKFGTLNAASFTFNSDTSLTAVSPAVSAAGVVDVVVTTAGGPSATSSADQFTYIPTYTVTTNADDMTGVAANCTSGGGNCSLRDAIAAANAANFTGTSGYQPTINLAGLSGQTITLNSALNPTANVNIAGPGAASLTIAAATANYSYNAFTSTTNSIAFTLSGVTVTGFGIISSTSGGALNFTPASSASGAGLITLNNDTFTNNGGTPGGASASSSGGAVSVQYSSLAVTGSTFTGNSAGAGGAILVESASSVTINGSTFGTQAAPNRALTGGGGAVFLYSPTTISTSSFSYNTALVGGAISANGNSLMLNTDVFLNNAATTTGGGAVYVANNGFLVIAGSTFNNNTAKTDGGAIYETYILTVSGSSFSMNQVRSTTASVYGGAIYDSYNNITPARISNTNFLANQAFTTAAGAYGGALYVGNSTLTNVLFSGNSTSSANNSSGGALYFIQNAYGSIPFTGVTFTGNGTSGSATNQNGGAIYGNGNALRLFNTTISGNSAKTGGGLYNVGGTLTLDNAIVSGNTGTTSYPDISTATTSESSSYVGGGSGTTCTGSCTPLLSALGNYGGGTVGAPGYTTPVQVMLPLPGSPLLAAGSLSNVGAPGTLSGGATTDARGTGYPRTTSYSGSPHVDIGAAEANYTLAFVQQPINTAVGATVSPAPTVQLLESGVVGGDGAGTDPGSYAGGTLAIAATPVSASAASLATTASGLEGLSESFAAIAPAETLTVSAQSGAATPVTVASATSNAFNITGSSKTITFTQLASPVAAGSSATLMATVSNGDAVTFSVTAGTGTASVSGNTITYLTAGTVTVNADSAATSTYYAAATVSYTVTILPPLVFLAGSGSVASLNASGSVTTSAVAGGGIGAAIDSSGTTWSLNSGGTGISTFTPTGALGTAYTGIGLSGATALAIDGNSKVVIANGNGQTETLSNTGVVVSTTQGSTSAGGSGVAIDLSGNVWVANPSTNSVDEIVGGATPVVPLANAVSAGTPATKP